MLTHACLISHQTFVGDSRGYLLLSKDEGNDCGVGDGGGCGIGGLCESEDCGMVGADKNKGLEEVLWHCEGKACGSPRGDAVTACCDPDNGCVNTYIDIACMKRQQEKMAGVI
ncbi:hypothetical protein EON63_16890 [archaeon]|nr:MAG: hypothetical protein EON63_16890 [archaeon]